MKVLPYMVREFTEADYATLEQWWDAHRSQSITPTCEMLPKIGYMAVRQENGEPDACLFLILADNAPMSMIEFPASRPGIGLERARAAFSALICMSKHTAHNLGRTYMLAYTLPGVARELRHHGFQTERKNMVLTAALTAP